VPGQTIFVGGQPIRLYVEAGQMLAVNVDFGAGVGADTVLEANFSGYLVDGP
jgi:hypothetical protein